MPKQVPTTPAIFALWDSAGARMIHSDEKGLETDWRKHDNSSFAREVWIYDAATDGTAGPRPLRGVIIFQGHDVLII